MKDRHDRSRQKKLRDERFAFIQSIKGTRCVRCGESDPVCLDFHHIDPKSKSFPTVSSIAVRRTGLSFYRAVAEEVAKCIVLCANCHRKEHRTQWIAR